MHLVRMGKAMKVITGLLFAIQSFGKDETKSDSNTPRPKCKFLTFGISNLHYLRARSIDPSILADV